MKIAFTNISKNKLPFLIDLKTDSYHVHLSKNSKRHYNKYIKSKSKYNIEFTTNTQDILNNINELYTHFDIGISSIISIKNATNIHFLKITDMQNSLIACNLYYITNSPTYTYVYSLCPYIKNHDFDITNLIWFETINYFRECNYDFLDIEYDNPFKIKNNKSYDLYTECYTFQHILNDRQKTNGFGNCNSSKFLFLTDNEKQKTNEYFIVIVCDCGQKNLINIICENICFNCNAQLNIIYD